MMPIPKTDTNLSDNIIMGDLSCKIIDQLATIVDEVITIYNDVQP